MTILANESIIPNEKILTKVLQEYLVAELDQLRKSTKGDNGRSRSHLGADGYIESGGESSEEILVV